MAEVIAGRSIRFKPGSYVRNMRTGRVYEIVHGPEIAKLENSNEACYIFRRVRLHKEVGVTNKELEILRVLTAAAMEKFYVTAQDINYASIYGSEYPT